MVWDTYTWLFVCSIFLALFVAWVSKIYDAAIRSENLHRILKNFLYTLLFSTIYFLDVLYHLIKCFKFKECVPNITLVIFL